MDKNTNVKTNDKSHMENFIIFDTEFASWKGFIDLSVEEQRISNIEIVQIAAIKINISDMSVVEEFNIFIKPQITPKLTQYFMDLTGITDELLEKEGTTFQEAYKKFKNFVGNLPCYSHGWGLNADKSADGCVMNNNLKMFNISDKSLPDYRNIAPWFANEYKKRNINITKQSSGQIAKNLGKEKELEHLGLDEHNALYDVYSILIGLKYLNFNELP